MEITIKQEFCEISDEKAILKITEYVNDRYRGLDFTSVKFAFGNFYYKQKGTGVWKGEVEINGGKYTFEIYADDKDLLEDCTEEADNRVIDFFTDAIDDLLDYYSDCKKEVYKATNSAEVVEWVPVINVKEPFRNKVDNGDLVLCYDEGKIVCYDLMKDVIHEDVLI